MQHLRRFARPRYIPEHVTGGTRSYVKEMHSVRRTWSTAPAMIQSSDTTMWEWKTNPKHDHKAHSRLSTLWLLVCPVKAITQEELCTLLLDQPPFASSAISWAYPLELKKVVVPLLPPTNTEQANEWSTKYWPTFYRKTNPFGAHPATIQRAESELHEPITGCVSVEQAMRLAEDAAEQTVVKDYGTRTGCVVIERSEERTEIIAVAGDARYKPLRQDSVPAETCSFGNPACHAVMRAIGMVGRKRLRCASQTTARAASKASHTLETAHIDQSVRDAFFLDQPLTDTEQVYFERDNLIPDGYLCLKLEFFLTHEPCVMCSMALVHSRVGRVIFRDRMPRTGGLTAEMPSNVTGPVGLGYGLCWRKELNWQFMCWEYINPTIPKLPDLSTLSLHSTFTDAVDANKEDSCEIEMPEAKTTTTVEKYFEPLVHHRHRKRGKKHTTTSSSEDDNTSSTAATSDIHASKHKNDFERTHLICTNPNVSSFASIHV